MGTHFCISLFLIYRKLHYFLISKELHYCATQVPASIIPSSRFQERTSHELVVISTVHPVIVNASSASW